MNRRQFLASTAIAAAVAATPFQRAVIGAPQSVAAAVPQRPPVPFDPSSVRQMAKEMAQKPFQAPDQKLPSSLKDIDYDHYR